MAAASRHRMQLRCLPCLISMALWWAVHRWWSKHFYVERPRRPRSFFMQWLSPVLMAILVISSQSVILLVLLQQGKGPGQGTSFGVGSFGSLLGATCDNR